MFHMIVKIGVRAPSDRPSNFTKHIPRWREITAGKFLRLANFRYLRNNKKVNIEQLNNVESAAKKCFERDVDFFFRNNNFYVHNQNSK